MPDDDYIFPDWAADAKMLLAVHAGSSPNKVYVHDAEMEAELTYFLVLIDREPRKIAIPDLYFADFSGVHNLH